MRTADETAPREPACGAPPRASGAPVRSEAVATPVRTYAHDAGAWRAYQPLLPQALRLAEPDDVPDEERWAWRGLSVHLDRFAVPDAPTTTIVLHGGGGYGRILAAAGKVVRDLGHEAVMPDLPGYGLTDAPAERVRYEEWVALVADLIAAERERAGRPVVLLGMSMGGMLAWHAAAAAPRGAVAGVVATTLMDVRDPVVLPATARFPAVGRLAGPLLRSARLRALDGLRIPMPLLGDVAGMANDPRLVDVFKRDRLGAGVRIPLGFIRSWLRYRPALEPEAWDRAPVLVAHPDDDRWTAPSLSRRFFDRLPAQGSAAARWVDLPRCGHLPAEEPGLTVLRTELARFLEETAG